jgi:hypothetical protein
MINSHRNKLLLNNLLESKLNKGLTQRGVNYNTSPNSNDLRFNKIEDGHPKSTKRLQYCK